MKSVKIFNLENFRLTVIHAQANVQRATLKFSPGMEVEDKATEFPCTVRQPVCELYSPQQIHTSYWPLNTCTMPPVLNFGIIVCGHKLNPRDTFPIINITKKKLVSYFVTVNYLTYMQSVAYIVPQSEQLLPIVDDEVAVGLMRSTGAWEHHVLPHLLRVTT